MLFWTTIGNERRHRDTKLVTAEKRKNYKATKWFSKRLLAIEMGKTKVKITKLIYLAYSILYLSRTEMYEFWYHYIKEKNDDTAKLC